MKYHYLSDKNLLKRKVKELNYLLIVNANKVNSKIKTLIKEVKELILTLRTAISQRELKRILGASLIAFLGMTFSQEAKSQSFSAPVQNPFDLNNLGGMGLFTYADLDNDGDYDLLCLSYNMVTYEAGLAYIENIGTRTAPKFEKSNNNLIEVSTTEYYILTDFADLDNDGDYDLVYLTYDESAGSTVLNYFENVGTKENPDFEDRGRLLSFQQDLNSVTIPRLADIDGDGDQDIIFGTYGEYEDANFVFIENDGTPESASFKRSVLNPFGLKAASSLIVHSLSDMDGDGDLDILSGGYYGDFEYYENVGDSKNPSFKSPVINPFGLTNAGDYNYPITLDMDGDGDIDVLTGANYFGEFVYFENEIIDDIREKEKVSLNVFPNPTVDQLTVRTDSEVEAVEIYDAKGQLVAEHNISEFSVKELKAGVYQIRVKTHSGHLGFSSFTKK